MGYNYDTILDKLISVATWLLIMFLVALIIVSILRGISKLKKYRAKNKKK